MKRRFEAFVLAASAVMVTAVCASAEPLVKMEGDKPKPGVVTAWSSQDNKVELTVKAGADPKAVADAIQAGVPKVNAKVKGGKVLVVGKSEGDLLKALSGVDLGGDEDIAIAAAKGSEDEGEGSGSSLRAKKTADLARLFADAGTTAQGKVVSVTPGEFPHATVVVQVLRGPTGALAASLKKGAKVTFKPVLKMSGKAPDWNDEDTQVNIGAWYLRAGDQVRIKLGKQDKDTFEAVLIDRQ